MINYLLGTVLEFYKIILQRMLCGQSGSVCRGGAISPKPNTANDINMCYRNIIFPSTIVYNYVYNASCTHDTVNISMYVLSNRSVRVGLTISCDYWWTLRGIDEVCKLCIHTCTHSATPFSYIKYACIIDPCELPNKPLKFN